MRFGLLVVLIFALAGCSGEQGPKRYRVSGTITFDGKPVPHGAVLFSPDTAKGNTGPQGIAEIKDGKYDTAGSRAPGIAGGATIVRVTALSNPNGKLLCEHEFSVELPNADSTHDIQIPASAAKKKASGAEI
jgi:hypothetical protein